MTSSLTTIPIVTKMTATRSSRTAKSRVVVLARARSVDASANLTHPIVNRCVSYPGTEHLRCILSEAKVLNIRQFLTVECVLRAVAVAACILFAGAISPDLSLAEQAPGGCCERGRERCRKSALREERCSGLDPLCYIRQLARGAQLTLCDTSWTTDRCGDTCCITGKCPTDLGPVPGPPRS